MARVVTVVCNICYASGKILQVGQKFDLEDSSLDSKVVAVLEEQLKKGRVVEVFNKPNPLSMTGVNRPAMNGVEPENDMTAHDTEVQETPVEPTAEEESIEDEPSTDTVIADLASATKNMRRSFGKRK